MLFLHLCVWITIASQFICTLYGFKVWKQLNLTSLMWLSIYFTSEFMRSLVGFVMANLAIRTSLFYHYSGQFSETLLFVFALTILKEKKFRVYISIAYGLALSTFAILEFLNLPIAVKELIRYSEFLDIIIGIVLLRDRLLHQQFLNFKQDPWSVIAMIILATASVSLIAVCSMFFSTENRNLNSVHYFFVYVNCFSILIRYILITIQLKKLKNLTLT